MINYPVKELNEIPVAKLIHESSNTYPATTPTESSNTYPVTTPTERGIRYRKRKFEKFNSINTDVNQLTSLPKLKKKENKIVRKLKLNPKKGRISKNLSSYSHYHIGKRYKKIVIKDFKILLKILLKNKKISKRISYLH